MATSSFDSQLKITKKTAQSLIDIINDENYTFIDLQTNTQITKLDTSKPIKFAQREIKEIKKV